MTTLNDYKKLSPARKAYIEKQAAKKGSSVEDYLAINTKPETVKSEVVHATHPIDGFKPDAGIYSEKGSNYYWLQTGELVQSTAYNIGKYPAVRLKGVEYVEITSAVDIMDKEGKTQMVTSDEGFLGTFLFTKAQLSMFANQIDKGGMSVRIQGAPLRKTSTGFKGDNFKPIIVENTWSAGNNSGSMLYMVMTNNGIAKVTSKEMSDTYRNVTQQMAA